MKSSPWKGLNGKAHYARFINGLKLARNLANLGNARALVIDPASTFCRKIRKRMNENPMRSPA